MDQVRDAVKRYWGFDSLRPLQESAIGAALSGKDSLTVLPTGGGKSLCYQVPPAELRGRYLQSSIGGRFKPIFDRLQGVVPYEKIRLACAFIRPRTASHDEEIP